jgi:Deoxynucleoside kinase.
MNLRKKYNIPSNAIITVAGMVGVGKSTMTKALAEKLGFRTSFENVMSNPYLDKFYHDFRKWSFHLQIFFLAERFKEQKRMFEYGGGFVQDRSIYEDVGIFARMHYEKGTMSPEDYRTYSSLFEAMVMTPFFHHPDLLIYLEGPFEKIVERIRERGRPMEQETPLEYWRDLYNRYDQWIRSFNACPVLRLNICEYDLRGNGECLEEIIEKMAMIMNEAKKCK